MMTMLFMIGIVIAVGLVTIGRALHGKFRSVENVIDEKCENVVAGMGGKIDELKDKISDRKVIKNMRGRIYGEETKTVDDDTMILGRWAANVYDVYGNLYKTYPIVINEFDEESTIAIGRARSSDICIGKDCEGHEYVGRDHAILRIDNRTLKLINNDSENGIIDEAGNSTNEVEIVDGAEATLSGLIKIKFEEYGPVDYYILTRKLRDGEYYDKHEYELTNVTVTDDGYIIA